MYITKSKTPVLLIALLMLLFTIPAMTFAEAGTAEIAITNTPVKGLIQIEKQGPVLTGFNEHQDPFGNLVYTPIYGTGYLEGAVFEVRAVEDIVGKDGTVWFRAGDLADTIVTRGEKTDQSKLLPLGHYYVTEVSAPDGYAFDSTRFDVVLEARDHETPMLTVTLAASNELMPARISLKKEKEVLSTVTDADGMVTTTLAIEPGEGFVFGLFCMDQLNSKSGSLNAGSLMATAISEKNGAVSFYGRFPAGTYEVRELSGPEGWTLNPTPRVFSLPADTQIQDGEMRLAFEQPVLNRLIHAEVRVSKTDLTGSNYTVICQRSQRCPAPIPIGKSWPRRGMSCLRRSCPSPSVRRAGSLERRRSRMTIPGSVSGRRTKSIILSPAWSSVSSARTAPCRRKRSPVRTVWWSLKRSRMASMRSGKSKRCPVIC